MSAKMLSIYTKQKCDKEAEEYREIGNKHFQEKDWFDALLNYNKSIAYAETKTVASLGYGNRSAVFLEIARFEDCLKNIQWALENEYPENKREKLLERNEKCEKLMREMRENEIYPWDIFQLSYPANVKVPWVVDCVEVRHTEKYGRGIYGKQVLKAGDIICIEETIINYTNEKGVYMRCYNCSKSCAMNLIPCDHTATMMFCSVPCKEDFYLKAFNIDKIASADVKMLADIAAVFKSVNNFDEIMQKLMTCLLSLSTNNDRVEDPCHIREYVSEKTANHILSIYNLNQKDTEYILKLGANGDVKPGFHISLFASLINHSCQSNAFCITLDNKVFTIIHVPVRRGQQITVKYDYESGKEDVEQVEKLHKFKCECDSCAHPQMMSSMFLQTLLQQEIEINCITPALYACRSRDPRVVKEFWKKVWTAINRNPTFPKIFFSNFMEAISYLKVASAYLTYPFI